MKKYLARFGYSQFEHDFNVKLKANSSIVRNAVNHIVDVRNSIAHGDPSASKTPKEVNDHQRQVKVFCRTVDDLFCTWARKKVCPLR